VGGYTYTSQGQGPQPVSGNPKHPMQTPGHLAKKFGDVLGSCSRGGGDNDGSGFRVQTEDVVYGRKAHIQDRDWKVRAVASLSQIQCQPRPGNLASNLGEWR
jgi:hypothetical protein